jgi:hypothetical protein
LGQARSIRVGNWRAAALPGNTAAVVDQTYAHRVSDAEAERAKEFE